MKVDLGTRDIDLGLVLKVLQKEPKSLVLKVQMEAEEKWIHLEQGHICSVLSEGTSQISLFHYLKKLKLVPAQELSQISPSKQPTNEELSQILSEEGRVPAVQVSQAMGMIQQRQAAGQNNLPYLAVFLQNQGHLTAEQVEEIVSTQRYKNLSFSKALAESRLLPPDLVGQLDQIKSSIPQDFFELPRLGTFQIRGRVIPREEVDQVVREYLLEGDDLKNILLARGLVTNLEVEELQDLILAKMEKPSSVPRLGEYLIARGLVTHDEIDEALADQKQTDRLLGEVLMDLGYLNQEELDKGLDKIAQQEYEAYIPTSLSRLLIKQEKITQEAMEEVLSRFEISEEELAHLLEKEGVITQNTLYKIFQHIVEEELAQVFLADGPHHYQIEFTAPQETPSHLLFRAGFSLEVDEVVPELYERLAPEEKGRRWTLGLQEIFYPVEPPLYQEDLEEQLEPNQLEKALQLVTYLDGKHTLDEMLIESQLDIWQAHPILKNLLESGLIERYTGEELLNQGETAFQNKSYSEAIFYFELLRSSPKYKSIADRKIPMAAKMRGRKRLVIGGGAGLVASILLVAVLWMAAAKETTIDPIPDKNNPPSEMTKMLEEARNLKEKGEYAQSFTVYQKLLDKGYTGDKVKLPLRIQTDPPGVKVFIEAQLEGTTTEKPLVASYTPTSKVRLRLEKEGYVTRETELDGSVFIDRRFQLYRHPEWEYSTGVQVDTPPWVGEEGVVVSCRNGTVYHINHEGELVWKQEVGKYGDLLLSPLVDGKLVLIGNRRGSIYALSLDTGEQQWEHTVNTAIGPAPLEILKRNNRRYLAFAVGGDLVLFDVDRQTVFRRFTAFHSIVSAPRFHGDRVFVGSKDDCFYSWNVDTGRLMWKVETGGDIVHDPVVEGREVYFASNDGHLYRVEIESGKVLSRTFVPDKYDRMATGKNKIYLLSRDKIQVYSLIDKGLAPSVKLPQPARLVWFPGDHIVLGQENNYLTLWNRPSGTKPIWRANPPSPQSSRTSLILTGTIRSQWIVVARSDGLVMSFSLR